MFDHVYSHNSMKNAYKTDLFRPEILKQLILLFKSPSNHFRYIFLFHGKLLNIFKISKCGCKFFHRVMAIKKLTDFMLHIIFMYG